MITTFVTGFFDLREDRSKDKSPEVCFSLFRELASSGVPIHAFVDPVQEPHLGDLPSNVTLEWLTQTDLTIAQRDLSGVRVPITATPHHDTLRFHVLMNSKAELVCRAMEKHTTPQQAWIDFGIFHVLRDRAQALQQLKLMAQTRQVPGVHIPGCWNRGMGSLHSVNWRFCGGFFLGDPDSLRDFWQRNLAQVDVLLAQKMLHWEVNVWHQMELAGWQPLWQKGDHNNSILEIPMQSIQVVAALTTIPSRANAACRLAIQSVLPQVQEVYLCVSRSYRRFGEWTEFPEWFSQEPKLRVIVGEDWGSATKQKGAYSHVPAGAWVFTMDDDQEQAPDLISRMLSSVKALGAYQNHYHSICRKTSGGLIHGQVGNLIPEGLLRDLKDFPFPEEARCVDDQWLSVQCCLKQIPIFPTLCETYSQIFQVLQNGHEKLGVDSLSGLGNRDHLVSKLAAEMGVRFNGASCLPLSEPTPTDPSSVSMPSS